MTNTVYLDGIPLEDDEIGAVSEEYAIPYDVVAELLAQYRSGKEINSNAYSGVVKNRVNGFISMLSREVTNGLEAEAFANLEVVSKVDVAAVLSDPEQIDDKEQDIAALMQIVTDPISEHFVIREGGQATLRMDNPPSLEQAYKVIDRIFVARDVTEKIDDYSTWLLGSITSELENHFGNQFDVSQVIEVSDKAYNTIVTAVSVFKEYNGRKFNLSFSHHKEAFYSKIEKADKDLILKKAEEIGLSAKNVRSLASICKKLGNSVIVDLTSKDQVDDLIAACKDASVDYVTCDENNLWKRTKSMTEPTAAIVINLKTNVIKIDGKEQKLKVKD
jgi:hypothetical protein